MEISRLTASKGPMPIPMSRVVLNLLSSIQEWKHGAPAHALPTQPYLRLDFAHRGEMGDPNQKIKEH